MDNVVLQMLEKYKCQTSGDYENALKEIMQEIALLGLWRAKFFEHGLFYGGTALRMLYGLRRFSEDLDFSLLVANDSFDLRPYHQAIKIELEAFGFNVTVVPKEKNIETQIESAFIKALTKIHFIKVSVPEEISSQIQTNRILKIKIELDTNPPGHHKIEVRNLLHPIPFQVKTMSLSDLFAGKCHALLARQWKGRVKGRDFYDYIWYLSKNTSVHLEHLEARLIQSGHWNQNEKLTEIKVKKLFKNRFDTLDIEQAKADVVTYLNTRERASLEIWSNDFFNETLDKITFS